MSSGHKFRYFTFGIVAAIVAIPLTLKAVSTIPVEFREGDLISATLFNSILKRIDEVQTGFSHADDLHGRWICKAYQPLSAVTNNDGCPGEGLFHVSDGSASFNSKDRTFAFNNIANYGACRGREQSGKFDVVEGRLVTTVGTFEPRRRNPNEMTWSVLQMGTGTTQNFVTCQRQDKVPAPVNGLTATLAGQSVTLNWVDQSNDETGFRVERRSGIVGRPWVTVATLGPDLVTYTDAGLGRYTESVMGSGFHSFRVIAINAFGDSITSSEVRVMIE